MSVTTVTDYSQPRYLVQYSSKVTIDGVTSYTVHVTPAKTKGEASNLKAFLAAQRGLVNVEVLVYVNSFKETGQNFYETLLEA